MDRICIYCGSNPGRDEAYVEAARELGRLLADRGIGVVYGGASVGMMGAVADAALDAGGEVIGVIPDALMEREVAHDGLTDLRVVGSMHERKREMVELADGFVALPGGLGTLEEIFEVLTWAQLGFHEDPCGLLDVASYYTNLVAHLDGATEAGFVREHHREMILVESDPATLLDRFADYEPPQVEKWLDWEDT
jgi:uncharacterized protein (TIGR00730 family)